MTTINVLEREEVSPKNQAIFDDLKGKLGFVPNLYGAYAHSETALENYLTFSGSKTSLSAKEREVINLAVSEVNQCFYCLSAHTVLGKMNGLQMIKY
ncbi:Alkylhydroperoxidase AhpD core [unidentified eubacterium SCB49]|nr:Alkylhydroperoxidase AhpD core [unidentified eubacterium SCB49]